MFCEFSSAEIDSCDILMTKSHMSIYLCTHISDFSPQNSHKDDDEEDAGVAEFDLFFLTPV